MKSKRRAIAVLFLSLVLTVTFSACGGKRLSGTYELRDSEGVITMSYRFDGGDCYIGVYLFGERTAEIGHKYKINNGELFLIDDSTSVSWGTIEVSGNSLIIGGSEYKKVK